MRVADFKKRLEGKTKELGKLRDELYDLEIEVQQLRETADHAIDSLKDAIYCLTELV